MLSIMTYNREIWASTMNQIDALAMAQKKMEQIILGIINVCDHRRNTWISQQTGVTDIIDHTEKPKH